MSLAKRLYERGGKYAQTESPKSIWTIGGKRQKNPYLGHRVKATWLRKWGKREVGFTVEGILRATFCVNGRTLIGEVQTDAGKVISCPWSRKWLKVEILEGRND
jgi:hypothetical protein